MGIARGRGGVRAGTVSRRGGLTGSLRVMRFTTPAVREKGLDLLDRGGWVGFVPAYGLAVAGLLASEAAAFLQQAVAQGSCYAQALGVVDVGSLSVELSGRKRIRSGRPSCHAS